MKRLGPVAWYEGRVSDVPRTRLAAHGLCVAEQKLLVVRQAGPVPEAGRWGLPGGGLDWGEAPEDAVVREFREETGLLVQVTTPAGVFSTTFMRTPDNPAHSVHLVSILFNVTTDGRELTHEVGGTTDYAEWVPLAALRTRPLSLLADFALGLLPK